MVKRKPKPLRILYASGPGNIIGTYQYWVNGEDDPSQVSLTYSGQFFDVCRLLNAEGYVISSFNQKEFLHDGQFRLEHRPMPLSGVSGVLYHLNLIWYGLHLIFSALRWRANVVVAVDGTTHWFVLSVLPYFGVKAIPSLHCTLLCKYRSEKTTEKLILKLNRHFFAKTCTAVLVASKDIAKQVEDCAGGQHRPIVEFLPTYSRTEFNDVAAPDVNRSPFRVLFIGRIERFKGVYDLLDIAQRFSAEGRQDIIFDICGTGSELEPLRLAVEGSGLESSFRFHGYCNKSKIREIFSQSHVVIVPTTTAFVEGFCQVAAESILAGRPVVTSDVVPALSYVRDAAVEVAPDDINGYGNALLKLYEDHEFYEARRNACFELQEQFYDISKGWGAGLKSILSSDLSLQ